MPKRLKLKIKAPQKKTYQKKGFSEDIIIPDWFDTWFQRNFGHKRFWKPVNIAEVLDRHPDLVYRALKAGDLEYVKLGQRSYVIPVKSLYCWLSSRLVSQIEDD
ncbi:hypothetical protein [Thermodesulfatator indicus]|uniref:hypothetical protein n=1 Tax=Thermodesulfatator indicus TaxID=171695 RepID=UPI00059CF5EA|nr:hypothetical protein [Thermodesulfatator indicus]